MKDLRTMQREGREGLAKSIYDQVTYTEEGMKPKWVEGGNSLKQDEARRMANKLDLDQHTANTWMAAQESMKKNILESGLLEEKVSNRTKDVCRTCDEYIPSCTCEAHNTLARDIKEFIRNMDTNSVDSIHLNKQAN